MTAPLTQEDVEAACRRSVPGWFLERLDTQLATVDVVPLLKHSVGQGGSVTACQDGPYPEYAVWTESGPRGVSVRIEREDEAIREGRIPWNQLANWSTIRACGLQNRPHEPRPGEQLEIA